MLAETNSAVNNFFKKKNRT